MATAGWTGADLARAVGRDPPDGTVRRALQSLEERGAIYRGEDKRWYHRNGDGELVQ